MLGNSDFTMNDTQVQLKNALGDRLIDVVLSDMAPNTSGIRDMDNERIIHLCYTVLRFAIQMSNVNATILLKLWQCGDLKTLENSILEFYQNVKVIKPNASRSDSAEIFLLGRNFKGLEVVE
jgi:23S rRNA (uridine2552-2'-O)-methyltransferase